ncbi:MAG: hypothetical protein LKI25_05560 [Atopobiaceae bacterium]|jgi:hypothetical protein|nr:hypothetical protein [Atopobiaceae bacterium]MCI2173667.1 hypothetical protein [Atopobiaceae bacterium]MCI2207691.1 hypothetical protein [Atopobiaceae bacterium]
MRGFLKTMVFASLISAGAVVAYRMLLDDDTKERISDLASTAADVARTGFEAVSSGQTSEADRREAEANRQWVSQQWTDLGY